MTHISTPMKVIDEETGSTIIEKAEGFREVLNKLGSDSEYAETIFDDFADYIKDTAERTRIAKEILKDGAAAIVEEYICDTDDAVRSVGSLLSADESLRFISRIREGA